MFHLLFQGEVLVKISDCCSKCEKAPGKFSIKYVCIFFHLVAHLAKGNVSISLGVRPSSVNFSHFNLLL